MNTVLITVLVVAIVSFVFAVLLTLADKYLNDYGIVGLYINDEEVKEIEGGNDLLSSLRNEKIFIPSACGGKATCGYCKVQVLDGAGPVLATERAFLTPQEEEDGVRLSCQVKVKEDIRIRIPEELFNVREYDVTVESMVDVTDTIKRVRLKLPDGESLNFKPGQYVQIMAPKYEGNDEEVYRAYSIASSALDSNHVELFIGYTGGIATTFVHEHLKEGDQVRLNGPYGDFYYTDEDSDVLLVGAGTGMAPLLSILHHMNDNNVERKVRLYFGARTPDDLFVLDEMKKFEEEMYDFEFMPTLSRVTEEMNWTGDQGRVNNSIEKYLEDGANVSCYLCGSPRMIDSIKESLAEKNIPEDRIYFDEF